MKRFRWLTERDRSVGREFIAEVASLAQPLRDFHDLDPLIKSIGESR
jgi:hypothetical protein